jgi:hypothetical protein
MSLVGGGMGLGQSATGLRFATTRGRIQGGSGAGVNYPSPFFDIAHTYLPTTVKQMFRWCRYYFLTQPTINATAFKLSEYPVTDIVIDHASDSTKKLWEEYLQDSLRYRAFQVEVGLDYHVYGNAFVGISFPFQKYLTCSSCKFSEQARKIRDKWVFTSYQFRLTCPQCGVVAPAQVKDFYVKDASGIRLVRWNPEDIEISYNDLTGHYTHYYNIPAPLRNDVVVGKKDVVEQIPQVFIQALRQQKGVIFNKEMLFHMKRPSISHQDRGWGSPLILPVLKDAFYMQIMKKAQEAILLEHIIPLRVLFPQAGSGSTDPFTTINLDTWRDHVAQEIARWKFDSNYIPILPLPIGQETIGGDGKALMLTQELQFATEQLMNGMMVPREFLMGGLSWSGSNVSLRMLENMFLGYIGYHKQLLRFVVQNIASFLEWPVVHGRFRPFKMADDIQRLSLLFQANQAQKVSDTTFLGQLDLSQEEENAIMLKETAGRLEANEKQQLATADIQGKSQMIMMKYQTKAQVAAQQEMAQPQAPGEPGGPEGMAGGTPGGQETADVGEGAQPQAGQAAPQGQQGQQGQQAQPAQSVPQGAQSQLGMQNQGAGMDLQAWAMMQAQQLASLPTDQQEMALQNLQSQNPELASLVRQLLSQMGGPKQQESSVDMRPAPEKLPARRSNGMV